MVPDKFDYRLLRAQLHTMSYLHLYLPTYPTAWICRKLDKHFLDVYVRCRTKFNSLKVAAAGLFVSTLMPPLYAHTIMANPCKETAFHVDDTVFNGTTRVRTIDLQAKDGCEIQDWLRSQRCLVLGPMILLGTLVVTASAMHVCKKIRHVQHRMLLFLKPVLPRIFYNGMGPAGTAHSAWNMFQSADLGSQYSWAHDLLGSIDLIVFCISLAGAVFLAFAGVGACTGGLRGAAIGAVAGAILSKYTLMGLNSFLGASDSLISYVEVMLQNRQPHRKFIRDANKIVDEHAICEAVEEAVHFLENHTGADKVDMSAVNELAARVKADGPSVLKEVAQWLVKHQEELPSISGVCYSLFRTNCMTFSCSEHMLAALSFLDVTMFLSCYFDPEWDVIRKFRPSWGADRVITRALITNPRYAMCKMDGNRWTMENWEAVHNGLLGKIDYEKVDDGPYQLLSA